MFFCLISWQLIIGLKWEKKSQFIIEMKQESKSQFLGKYIFLISASSPIQERFWRKTQELSGRGGGRQGAGMTWWK